MKYFTNKVSMFFLILLGLFNLVIGLIYFVPMQVSDALLFLTFAMVFSDIINMRKKD